MKSNDKNNKGRLENFGNHSSNSELRLLGFVNETPPDLADKFKNLRPLYYASKLKDSKDTFQDEKKPLGKGNYSGGFDGAMFVLNPLDEYQILAIIDKSNSYREQLKESFSWDEKVGPKRLGKVRRKEDYRSIEDRNQEEKARTQALEMNKKVNKFFSLYFESRTKNISKLSKEVKVGEKKLREWLKYYHETLEIPRIPVKRSTKKLTKEHLNFFHELCNEHRARGELFTIEDAINGLSQRFQDLSVSVQTVRTGLKRAGITNKKVKHLPRGMNDKKANAARIRWFLEAKQEGVDYRSNCIFIDEAAIDNNMKLKKAYAPLGIAPVTTDRLIREQSYTLLGAVCPTHVINLSIKVNKDYYVRERKKRGREHEVHSYSDSDSDSIFDNDSALNIIFETPGATSIKKPKTLKGPTTLVQTSKLKKEGKLLPLSDSGTNKSHFICFLWKVMYDLKDDPQLKNCFIVLDNSRLHNNPEIPSFVRYANYRFGSKFRLFSLPPYSPQLNPIEMYWNALKIELRLSQEVSIVDRVKDASKKCGNKNLANYVRHCYHNMDLAKTGKFFD